MTIKMWASLLTSANITTQKELDNARLSVAIGPMVLGKDDRLPLVLFQNQEQADFFNEHYFEIRGLLPE